jgi:hypothetical protein
MNTIPRLNTWQVYANFEKDTKPPTQNKQGIFHAYCMSPLDSEEETLSEFVNQPDSLDMACSFMLNRETRGCNFPLYPPMIGKYQKHKLSVDVILKLQNISTIGMTNKFALMNHTTDNQLAECYDLSLRI